MKMFTLSTVIRAGTFGALLGAAAGFAAGLLVAPEEGRKVRRRLVYQLERAAEQVGVLVDQVIQQPAAGSSARASGHQVVENAREEAARIRAEIDALIGEVRRGRADAPSTT